MAVKHQVLISRNPRHLVMITLNHLDAMMDFTTSSSVKNNIHTAYELLIQVQHTISYLSFISELLLILLK